LGVNETVQCDGRIHFLLPQGNRMNAYTSYVSVIGRFLLALMFILSGYGKLVDISGTAGYVASGGLPFPTLLATLVGAFELLGGIALVAGFRTRIVGLSMALFTIAASIVFHAYWLHRPSSSSSRSCCS